ncbi:MAG: tetratricopeptide repeat protein [Verrucomicrobiota bacterium]
MKSKPLFTILLLACFFFLPRVFSAEPAALEPTNSVSTFDTQAILRSNLQVQEQLYVALRAIEQARQEADGSARKNLDVFAEKLKAMETSLSAQRERDLESLRSSNRLVLTAASVVAGIGLLALLCTTYFQIRAMNRMADVGALFSPSLHLDSVRALGDAHSSVPARLNSAEQASARLLATIAQLEKRIHELEPVTSVSTATNQPRENSNGNSEPAKHVSPQIAPLLSDGEVFLNAGDAERALTCFEEALRVEPANPDALVKKGTALEALRKMPEAIETYDRAIAADSSMTVAYLYKGGVLNRLQRFTEAMECYEQALRTHPKNAV